MTILSIIVNLYKNITYQILCSVSFYRYDQEKHVNFEDICRLILKLSWIIVIFVEKLFTYVIPIPVYGKNTLQE